MALGADHAQTTGIQHLLVALGLRLAHGGFLLFAKIIAELRQFDLDVSAQHDIGTATGHVRGDGYRTRIAGLGHDHCLALVLLGVEHLVLDLGLVQQLRDQFRHLDGGGTDKYRLTTLHAVLHIFDDGLELFALGEVDQVGLVIALSRLVGGNDHHFQTIDLLKLEGLGVGGAGHARELVVEAEKVLESDRSQGLVFLLDRHPFLGLDCLVQAFRPTTPRHGTAGEFVNDDDLTIAHDVINVDLEDHVRPQRRHHVMHQHDVGGVVQALAFAQQAHLAKHVLDLLVTFVTEENLLGLLIDRVIARAEIRLAFVVGDRVLTSQVRRNTIDLLIKLGAVFSRTGNDQRRARLVDQDRVDLIDHRKAAALHSLRCGERHVVAQIIKAELIVGAVGDIAIIGLATRRLAQVQVAAGITLVFWIEDKR